MDEDDSDDDSGSDQPLIRELDLDSIAAQAQDELLESTTEHTDQDSTPLHPVVIVYHTSPWTDTWLQAGQYLTAANTSMCNKLNLFNSSCTCAAHMHDTSYNKSIDDHYQLYTNNTINQASHIIVCNCYTCMYTCSNWNARTHTHMHTHTHTHMHMHTYSTHSHTCMCACVCTHAHQLEHTHTQSHTNSHTHASIYIHINYTAHTHMYMCVCGCAHMCVCIHVCRGFTCTHTHMYTHTYYVYTYMYMYMYVYACVCVHECLCVCVYVYACT